MDKFQIGPAGGNGGKPFDHYDIPEGGRLTAIHIFADWVINGIQFDYIDADGQSGDNPLIGGPGGKHHIFNLDEDEYLTGISGRAGWYIDSIRFHTNRNGSPVYGGPGGDRDFSFVAPEGFEIGGLLGRSGWYIDALGVSVRRHTERTPLDDIDYWDADEETESCWSWPGKANRCRQRSSSVGNPFKPTRTSINWRTKRLPRQLPVWVAMWPMRALSMPLSTLR